MIGYLDNCSVKYVAGWAWNPACVDEQVSLNLLVDGIKVATTIADGYRKDLESIDGKGYRTYCMEVPDVFFDGMSHEISVVNSKTGDHVTGSPKLITFPEISSASEVTQKLIKENVLRSAGELQDPTGDGKKRVVVLAIHQKKGALDKNQESLVREFKNIGASIVIINSSLSRADEFISSTRELCDFVIVRGDHGRDFSSFVIACTMIWRKLMSFDQLILANDSIIGPVTPFAPVFEIMEKGGHDAWALTDSWETFYHVQSYFVVLERSGFLSQEFRGFLYNYAHPNEKSEVIAQGELGFSQALLSGALDIGVYCPYHVVASRWLSDVGERLKSYENYVECQAGVTRREGDSVVPNLGHVDYAKNFYLDLISKVRECRPTNPTHFFWDTLITDFGFPFIKRELFQYNPAQIPNTNWLYEILVKLDRVEVLALLFDAMKAGAGTMVPPLMGLPSTEGINLIGVVLDKRSSDESILQIEEDSLCVSE